jgi:hypothetical protein
MYLCFLAAGAAGDVAHADVRVVPLLAVRA